MQRRDGGQSPPSRPIPLCYLFRRLGILRGHNLTFVSEITTGLEGMDQAVFDFILRSTKFIDAIKSLQHGYMAGREHFQAGVGASTALVAAVAQVSSPLARASVPAPLAGGTLSPSLGCCTGASVLVPRGIC